MSKKIDEILSEVDYEFYIKKKKRDADDFISYLEKTLKERDNQPIDLFDLQKKAIKLETDDLERILATRKLSKEEMKELFLYKFARLFNKLWRVYPMKERRKIIKKITEKHKRGNVEIDDYYFNDIVNFLREQLALFPKDVQKEIIKELDKKYKLDFITIAIELKGLKRREPKAKLDFDFDD